MLLHNLNFVNINGLERKNINVFIKNCDDVNKYSTLTYRIEDESVPKRKHEHVFIHLKNGKIFRFECTRRFSFYIWNARDIYRINQD